jgi:hypothetical protein
LTQYNNDNASASYTQNIKIYLIVENFKLKYSDAMIKNTNNNYGNSVYKYKFISFSDFKGRHRHCEPEVNPCLSF